MKKLSTIVLLISIFLTGCSLGAAPEPTPDINALMGTSVAATLTAMPTNTPAPTDTPFPTDTPAPTETPEPIITSTFTLTPAPPATETLTPVPYVGCFAPAGTASISLGIFRFENNTKTSAEVYLHGVSLNGDKVVDCSYVITASENTEIIFGNYSYIVVVGNRTMTGSFSIVNDDKTTMRIFDKKVTVVGP